MARGRLAWFNNLTKLGRHSEAVAFAKRHRLAVLPAPTAAAPQAVTVPKAPAQQGEGGVQQALAAGNGDRLAPTGENLQLGNPVGQVVQGLRECGLIPGVPEVLGEVGVREVQGPKAQGEQDSPSGELEGEVGFCQGGSGVGGGKLVGVVGEGCRNGWYVECRVGEVWGKVERPGWCILRKGDVVEVEEVWRSGDGRDVEWKVVGLVGWVA